MAQFLKKLFYYETTTLIDCSKSCDYQSTLFKQIVAKAMLKFVDVIGSSLWLNFNPIFSAFVVRCNINLQIIGGSTGPVVMGQDSIMKVVGSNPGTEYWMDILHIYLL